MDNIQRDELAHILKQSEAAQTSFEHKLAFHQQTAGDLLAAGCRKLRTITTIEELATLKRGDVVASSFWADAFSYIGGEDTPAELANVATGERVTIGEDDDFFPATVVYAFGWAKRTPQE